MSKMTLTRKKLMFENIIMLDNYLQSLSGFLCMLPLQETSGSVAAATNVAVALGRDVVINGAFASDTIWTKGANWTIAAGVATHAAGAVETLKQSGIAAAGRTWRVTFTVSNRTAGTITPKIGASGTARSTNDTFTETITATGADLEFVPTTDFDGNIDDVVLKQTNIPANDSNLYGTHTGVTVGQPGNSRIPYVASYDGVTTVTDIYSAELNSIFNPDAGTIISFSIPDAADGNVHGLYTFRSDVNNYFDVLQQAANDDYRFRVNTQGSFNAKIVDYTADVMNCLAHTWSYSAPNTTHTFFVNGVQNGVSLLNVGRFTGNLSNTECALGALNTTPVTILKGSMAYVTLYNRALTAAETLNIARAGGVA